MLILGINTGLNASVVLIKDGKAVFGVQEERLSRIKNQPGFPKLAIDYALKSAKITLKDLDIIAIGGRNSKIALSREDDLNKFHNRYNQIKKKWFGSEITFFAELVAKAEAGIKKLSQSVAQTPKTLENYLDEIGAEPQKIKKYEHHLCHAASAYYGLAKDKHKKYLVFSMDGGGDGKTSAVYIGENGKLTEIASSDSFSPACIYAHITYIMGFMPHEHEYKLMGMAPYAQPKYAKIAKEILMRFVALDGLSFTNGPKYPGLRNSQGEVKQKLVEDLFKSVLNLRFDTLAAGLQLMAEEVALQWIKAGVAKTGIKDVLLSGGFFMNVKANKLISELPEIESVNVFPSCGDETNAFGAAFLAYNDSAKGEKP
ncbi:MAG: carbamoyltransferase N-terminal domain-containing protein [Candidatus Nanoarchaeia archaeon]